MPQARQEAKEKGKTRRMLMLSGQASAFVFLDQKEHRIRVAQLLDPDVLIRIHQSQPMPLAAQSLFFWPSLSRDGPKPVIGSTLHIKVSVNLGWDTQSGIIYTCRSLGQTYRRLVSRCKHDALY